MNISNYVQKPRNIAFIHKYDKAINQDIREAMETDFTQAVKQFRNIDKILKGKDEKETARLIWLFLKKHCKYRRDPDTNQIIRLPSFFLNHSPHLGDCKTFAMFARSAYASIYPDLQTAFKFAGYATPARNPTHVYTVVKDRNGKEIIIDGCYTNFDREKNYTLALPTKFKNMRISTLSGPGTETDLLSGINTHADQARRNRIKKLCALRSRMNTARALYDGGHITPEDFRARISSIENEATVNGIGKLSYKEKVKKAKAGWKKFGKGLGFGLAMINLAPVRGAFLSLVAMNLNGLASNMQLVYDDKKDRTGWNKIEKFWHKVGGFPKILIKAMHAGTKHKPLWMNKKSKARYQARVTSMKKEGRLNGIGFLEGGTILGEQLKGIGVAPAVAAAVIAMGASLLAGIIPILIKALKGKGTPQAQEATAVLQEQGREIVQQTNQGNGYQKAFTDDEGVSKDQAEMQAQEEETQNENVEGLGAMDPGVMDGLFKSLNTVMGAGLEFAGNVVQRKINKNPQLKEVLSNPDRDQYYAQQNATNLGYPTRYPRGNYSGGTGIKKYLPWAGGALVLGLVAKKMKLI